MFVPYELRNWVIQKGLYNLYWKLQYCYQEDVEVSMHCFSGVLESTYITIKKMWKYQYIVSLECWNLSFKNLFLALCEIVIRKIVICSTTHKYQLPSRNSFLNKRHNQRKTCLSIWNNPMLFCGGPLMMSYTKTCL